MLTWTEGMLCGAGGGLIVEAVVTFGRLHLWQQARHAARATHRPLPPVGAFVDPLADALAALFRVVLGGAAGWLLHGEVSGVFAAVAAGASAPAVLAQMGRAANAAEVLGTGRATAHGGLPEGRPGSAAGPPVASGPAVAPGVTREADETGEPAPGPAGLGPAPGEAGA
ncbi:hypothetical protein ABT104_12485 [Streptomyces mobaraensis]|uniref:hypothetical protein n=1 Tax=Streptomyces mobaraensis TaxID=35621 RepID=UPI00332737D2